MPLPLMMGGQEKQDNEKNALFQSAEQKAGGLEAASAAAAAALRSKGRNGINWVPFPTMILTHLPTFCPH